MRRAITGIDHCIVLVRDLDAALRQYRRLGFTVSSRGLHPPDHGTGNHTVMFDREYLEFLGVVAPTPSNEHWRRKLADREGLSGLALQTPSADAAAAEMNADGIALTAPADFARPVVMPDGSHAQAAFRTTQFPQGIAPGLHLFCCEHRTRHTTWLPELLQHANGAVGLTMCWQTSEDPQADATIVGRLFASEPKATGDGSYAVDTGNSTIRFQTPAGLARALRPVPTSRASTRQGSSAWSSGRAPSPLPRPRSCKVAPPTRGRTPASPSRRAMPAACC